MDSENVTAAEMSSAQGLEISGCQFQRIPKPPRGRSAARVPNNGRLSKTAMLSGIIACSQGIPRRFESSKATCSSESVYKASGDQHYRLWDTCIVSHPGLKVVVLRLSNGMNSHTMSFEQLMPVLLSMPVSTTSPSLPFKFVGGFALSTKTIGIILSVQGVYSMLSQIFLFPVIVRRFGSLATFRLVAVLYPLLYFAVPYLVLLPEHLRMAGVYLCLTIKVTAQVLAYPSNAIQLTNSAPSLLVLGAINGVAASTASLCRAFGPTVSGLIQASGLRMGYSGLAWWASALVCVLGAIESFWMTETDGRMDEAATDYTAEEEAGLEAVRFDPVAVDVAVAAAAAAAAVHLPTPEGPRDRKASSKYGALSTEGPGQSL